MKLDKNIIKSVNLNKIVKLDDARSYREGNLMNLTFEVVDKDENGIFSFVFESDRFVNTELTNIADTINQSKDGKNFSISNCLCKMFIWSCENGVYPKSEVFTTMSKFKKSSIFYDFMEYVSYDLFSQVGTIIDNLDFFSLQTKEEYMKDEKIINEYVYYWQDRLLDEYEEDALIRFFNYICDGYTPVDNYWKELFNNAYKYIIEGKYDCWLEDACKEIVASTAHKIKEIVARA